MTNMERFLNSLSADQVAKIIKVVKRFDPCKHCAYYGNGCYQNGPCMDGITEWLQKEVAESD